MEHNPLISVIVPAYNVALYLRQCLDSLVNQTYRNLEIILVNDGSTDDSPLICEEYAKRDSRIRVIHKANGGQASARNEGIRLAKGEYLSFIDSDDWVEPTMYERAIAEFTVLPNLSVVRFGYQEFYPDGSTKDECCVAQENLWQGQDILKSYATQNEGMNGVMCSSVYRREVFIEENVPPLLYIEGIVHEDEMLSMSLSLKLALDSTPKQVKVLADIMYHYRRGIESTVSRLTKRHMRDACAGFLKVRDYAATMKTPWGLFDAKIVSTLMSYSGWWIKAGISLSDITKETYELRSVIDASSLVVPSDKFLYRLYCYSPCLYFYFERVYAPIIRRLGISKLYK